MPAERGNMTDHADIVREFLDGNNVEGVRSARAALDALVVERDEARAAYQREVEAFRALGGSNLMQAIARAEAAEARVTELEQQRRELYSEVDCRIEHGADSNGHLEYVRAALGEEA